MKMVELLNYSLAPGVVAFSTTRRGGWATGDAAADGDEGPGGSYDDFNINGYCGDSEEHVARNREVLCRQLGIGMDRLIMPHQTHETRVGCIDDAFLALGAEERRVALEGVDALMTSVRGVCIGVSTADCIPLLLYDPVRGAVCAVHAGWRGTAARIAAKAVGAMTSVYGTRPADLVAQIGPGIGLDSFEVGQEVYDVFAAAGFDMEAISKRYPANDGHGPSAARLLPRGGETLITHHSSLITPHSSLITSKWHIDLPECNRLQLLDSGLRPDGISLCGICTYKAHDTFFSARRLGIRSGRIFTGILLTATQAP